MLVKTIRNRLFNYINNADENSLREAYTLLEDEINSKSIGWDDAKTIKELDKRVEMFEEDGKPTSSWMEVKENAKTHKEV
ncbi:hypothetical protein [Sphingobacterium psychroaquaticum]|uniref:Uncharacterized protein n=1 Tax=Sphingobacterium psychroaquaticum TaxID=561061 RepID=A0A1X7I0Z1_9SPHI|nr:hypothetical protein [Sphingobacterium psychroaquaticum]QBQ42026.1 hypothetical protein E2P86_13055 [Sphingobacterium psychroaquaticum]SMG07971.1 hypothetical protein SAMN05660862_0333 [Sphingobacterium psychroaquaticum]